MQRLAAVILALALGMPLAAWAEEVPAAPDASAPVEVVARATASHLDVLNALIDKVPEPARDRIEKAIEASRRGGEKALEALRKSHLEGEEAMTPTTASQVRGLERAIQAIEAATDRTTTQLETVLGRVPESAAQAITRAIDQIESSHAEVLARLEGLLESGVSTLHPPDRSDTSARPERPERPENPGQDMRPEVARPARPVLPDRPARPEIGRP